MSGPLFAHALRLHQQDPDAVLPRDPYPDDERHRRRQRDSDPRRRGAAVAAILDRHFREPAAPASDLAEAFHDVPVPIHRNDHIAAAALRADRQRVRETGRWLVRHGPDRCAVTVGLALLATDSTEDDIPLIQTIGLLSLRFGPLAAEALERRRGGEAALLWLADRTSGWGRVYLVEALCRRNGATSREWLLRHACNGETLDGYYAGQVATAAHLHEAITRSDVDDDLIDHCGRLLKTMAESGGMGTTLEHYPPAPAVLAAHATHLATQKPTLPRYVAAATLTDGLTSRPAHRSGCTTKQRDHIAQQYLATLNRPDWCATARTDLDPTSDHFDWFVANVATRLRLRAFQDPTEPDAG